MFSNILCKNKVKDSLDELKSGIFLTHLTDNIIVKNNTKFTKL